MKRLFTVQEVLALMQSVGPGGEAELQRRISEWPLVAGRETLRLLMIRAAVAVERARRTAVDDDGRFMAKDAAAVIEQVLVEWEAS